MRALLNTSPKDESPHCEHSFWFGGQHFRDRFGPASQADQPAALQPPIRCDARSNACQLRAGSKSVTGNYRSANEDRCWCDPAHGIFIVADGMGGHRGGARAAQVVTAAVSRHLQETLQSSQVELATVQTAVEEAVEIARREMIEYAESHPGHDEMGATMVLAIVIGDVLYVCHAGDCRVYHARNGQIRRLTCDQTLVQVMVDSGALPERCAKTHPWRHLVLNFVGVKELDSRPEVTALRLLPGDRFVLASDGLTGAVEDQAVCEIAGRSADPQEATDELVKAALRNGSKDNVSCVVVQVR